MNKPKPKEMALLGAPAVLLVLLGALSQTDSGKLFGRKAVGPAQLSIEQFTLFPITGAQAIDEIHTPMGQTPVPNTVSGPPSAFAEFRDIDHKASVIINYQGSKPSWWGQDDIQAAAGNGFFTSTASTLAWLVNSDLSYESNGKMRTYMTSKRSTGIITRGNPQYDATLDRYVAMLYLPLSQVPARNGRMRFAVLLYPNQVSPATKFSTWLNKKDKSRHVLKR
jgi:hypothetical protein